MREIRKRGTPHLLKSTLVPFAYFLLLVSFHLLVVQVLRGALYIVEAKFGMLFCFAGVVGQTARPSSRLVWLAVLQPGEQLRRPLFTVGLLVVISSFRFEA